MFKINNILIVNPFGIGDLLFSTPLIGILKNHNKNMDISYICNKRSSSILEGNPNIKNIFIFEKDDFRASWKRSKLGFVKDFSSFLFKLKKEKFDVVLDLSLASKYGFFFKAINIPKRVGFDYKKRGRFLTDRIAIDGFQDKHVVEYYFDLLELLGIKEIRPVDKRMNMLVSKKDFDWAEDFLRENSISKNDLILGIIPGCGVSWGESASYRRWDKDKFREVADMISKNFNYRSIIFGDTKEIELCNYIYNKMAHEPIMACGKTNLKQLAALLKKCQFIICNDGGPLHIAVSQDIRTFSIFGPVDEKVYGPYPPSSRHIVIKKDLPCRPCYKRFKHKKCITKDCINIISAEEVYNKVSETIVRNDTI